MPINLFDDLSTSGFHSSIFTTFSVDPAFYDTSVQYRLRANGCQNNLLMADGMMLGRALEQMPEAFINAGRKYLIVPMSGHGCFHPKVALRYGKSKARLVIGSANVTSTGWGRNQEVLSIVDWSQTLDTHDNDVNLGLIAKVHDWLMSRMPKENDSNLAHKLDLIVSQSRWLANVQHPPGKQRFSDGTEIEILLSDPGQSTGLATKFIERVAGEVERLVVVSPYWDGGLHALGRFHHAFGNPATHIFMAITNDASVRQSTFPVEAWQERVPLKFHPLTNDAEHRFLHAKLIMAQTKDHDYLMYGSANCTLAANGTPDAPGINTEAAIFRRLERGTIDRHLALDYEPTLQASDIRTPVEEENQEAGPVSFHPGRIELRNRRLSWTCPEGILSRGSHFQIGEQRFSIKLREGRRPFVTIGKELTGASIIVRIELADGRISRPVIVSDPEMLMAAAPNPLAGNLKRKLDAVLNGESDLINLARDIHLIFSDDAGKQHTVAKRASQSSSESVSTMIGKDYESPEEFRRALSLKTDLTAASFIHADNPALQMILKIVLRGIIYLEDSDTIDEAEAKEAADLIAGEDQDDVGASEGVFSAKPKQPIFALSADAPISSEDFNRNRTAMLGAISKFENHIEALRNGNDPVGLDFVTRSLFMIYLMLYGCTRQYKINESDVQVLMPFSGIGTSQQQDGFLLQAARIVNGIWGPDFKNCLMSRIPLDKEDESLPVPILTLIVLSRWILAAILNEARVVEKAKSLSKILEPKIPQLFATTHAFSDISAELIDEVIGQMEKNMGMEQLQASAIHTVLDELESSMKQVP